MFRPSKTRVVDFPEATRCAGQMMINESSGQPGSFITGASAGRRLIFKNITSIYAFHAHIYII